MSEIEQQQPAALAGRTRHTCPSSGDEVATVHLDGSELACPLCGRRVVVAEQRLPQHNYRTKAEIRVARA